MIFGTFLPAGCERTDYAAEEPWWRSKVVAPNTKKRRPPGGASQSENEEFSGQKTNLATNCIDRELLGKLLDHWPNWLLAGCRNTFVVI